MKKTTVVRAATDIRIPGYWDDGSQFWGNTPPPRDHITPARDADWWLGRTFDALGHAWTVQEIDGNEVTLTARGLAQVVTTLDALNLSMMTEKINVY